MKALIFCVLQVEILNTKKNSIIMNKEQKILV